MRLITDPGELKIYGQDMSRYHLEPAAAAIVASEEDVTEVLRMARTQGLSVTPRGAGSNLSGSAVGSGIVVHFKEMSRVLSLEGDKAVVEPGTVYDRLNELSVPRGFFLPYHVSSSKYCTIGGNVGTKASGLRSIKYGTVDTSVSGIRFASPRFGIVDTTEGLPEELRKGILDIRADLMADVDARSVVLEKTRVKTSSGYNLRAFLDHDRPSDIVAHLMVGSVGTLGIFTRIYLDLVPVPTKRTMVTAFFDSPSGACSAVPELSELGPSLLELMDGFGAGIVKESGSFPVPEGTGSVLMVEFDSEVDDRLGPCLDVLSRTALGHRVLRTTAEQDIVWGLRWSMLLRMKKENEGPDRRYISFVDDLGVPVESLPAFIREIEGIFRDARVPLIIYGHVGEGNLHLRPLIEREGWKERVTSLAGRCFDAAFRYGGTIAAEHGSGRNRAAFIRKEWGDGVYSSFRRVTCLFDPQDVLNPGVMFSEKDLTSDLEF